MFLDFAKLSNISLDKQISNVCQKMSHRLARTLWLQSWSKILFVKHLKFAYCLTRRKTFLGKQNWLCDGVMFLNNFLAIRKCLMNNILRREVKNLLEKQISNVWQTMFDRLTSVRAGAGGQVIEASLNWGSVGLPPGKFFRVHAL